jgi:hypothetical protein
MDFFVARADGRNPRFRSALADVKTWSRASIMANILSIPFVIVTGRF